MSDKPKLSESEQELAAEGSDKPDDDVDADKDKENDDKEGEEKKRLGEAEESGTLNRGQDSETQRNVQQAYDEAMELVKQQQEFAYMLRQQAAIKQQEEKYQRLLELREILKETEPSEFDKRLQQCKEYAGKIVKLTEPLANLAEPISKLSRDVKKAWADFKGTAVKLTDSIPSISEELHDVSEKVIDWPPRSYREGLLGPTLYEILMEDPLDDKLKRPQPPFENYCDLVVAPVAKAKPLRHVVNKIYKKKKQKHRVEPPIWAWYDLFLGPTVDNSYCTTMDMLRSLFSWGEKSYVSLGNDEIADKVLEIINDLAKYRGASLDRTIREEERIRNLRSELRYLESLVQYQESPDEFEAEADTDQDYTAKEADATEEPGETDEEDVGESEAETEANDDKKKKKK